MYNQDENSQPQRDLNFCERRAPAVAFSVGVGLATSVAGCGDQSMDNDGTVQVSLEDLGEPSDFADDLKAEHAQYEADMVFFGERRKAFEQHGIRPTVPPSLSSDPQDPEYEFRGYMNIATEDEERADRARLELARREPVEPSDREIANELTPVGDDPVVGIFVNDAGETWAWKPKDIGRRLEAQRVEESGDPDIRSTSSSHMGEQIESLTSAFRSVIGADNRKLRSADSGHDMTSYPWRVIGPLVTNGRSRSASVQPRCSAAKIGERYLLTAAHCVFTGGGGSASLKTRDWWPGADGVDRDLNGGDGTPNNYKNVLWYYADSNFVDNGWVSRDHAVLVLYDNANSCSFGSLGYRVDNSLVGQQAWHFGYAGRTDGSGAPYTCADSPMWV